VDPQIHFGYDELKCSILLPGLESLDGFGIDVKEHSDHVGNIMNHKSCHL
jgi:hypothetical protein